MGTESRLVACLSPLLAGLVWSVLMVGAQAQAISGEDFRIIFRLTAPSAGALEQQVDRLAQRPGVTDAKPLHQLGMVVVRCSSEQAQEQLLEELDEDQAVGLAVPDSWLSVDEGSKTGAHGPTAPTAVDRTQCSANPACAARGLTGACCPVPGGDILSCCSMHDEATTITISTYHGTYLSAHQGALPDSASDQVNSDSKFELITNANGNVSFRTHFGTYLSAHESGRLASDRAVPDTWEQFTLVYNDNATVSLKTFFGTYVAADPDGSVVADRVNISTWEQFHISKVEGPHQHLPNDPALSKLWGMNSWSSHDIDAPEAWKTWTGEQGAGIVVGVIDTGIDYRHEDLKEQMWVNANEIPDNGIDDDGNGYVDDVHGANFADDHGDPWDDQLHGTHCSGTIAGVGNNGIGVAGVAWRGVRLMALKFLTATGSGRTSDAIKAIDYAVAHGAKVLSNSWGGGGSSSALRVAIERAEDAGLLFVAAAGNEGSDNDEQPHYPSNYEVDSIISVASTTHEGKLSSFSCFGAETVHVAAPGSQIYSTVPKDKYKYLSGTSMATPHVSGLAALVWMYRPQLSMPQLKRIILESAEKYSTLEGKISTGGLINAKDALETAWAFAPPIPPAHAPLGIAFEDEDPTVGAYSGTVTIAAAADESDVDYYRIYFVSGAGFQLEPLSEEIPATGEAAYAFQVNGSFARPHYAVSLAAVAGRASGEIHATLGDGVPHVVLEDYGVPDLGPSSVVWGGDADTRSGWIAGTLHVGRARSEAAITHYNVYWVNASGTRGEKVGSIPAIGFSEPVCTGNACGLVERNQDAGVYSFERGAYQDNEVATFRASGPGSVVVTRVETEEYYDTLTVAGEALSGDLSTEVPKVFELPAGPAEIAWASDASLIAGGWAFTLMQTGTDAEFLINATQPKGTSFEVVSAYGENEFGPGMKIAVLVDYDDSMPPSPAFSPALVSFEDEDPGVGVISGTVHVQPAANGGDVDFYRVELADPDAVAHGSSWTVQANGSRHIELSLSATVVPAGVSQIIVRAGNSRGVSTGFKSAALVDLFPYLPGNVSWSGDVDVEPGVIAGDVIVEPAESEVGIKAYIAYWYDGVKMEEVARATPRGHGVPTSLPVQYGTEMKADWILVVSLYRWGETDEGSLVEVVDVNGTDDARRLGGVAGAHAASASPAKASKSGDASDLWLVKPAGSSKLVWSPDLKVAALTARGPRVRSAITLPGLDAKVAATPKVRAAFAQAVVAVLRLTKFDDVRILRVSELSQEAAAQMRPGGRRLAAPVERALRENPTAAKVDFEVTPADGRTVDRVEARLILLSTGGLAAARFDAALAQALAGVGISLPAAGAALRFRIAEPQQLRRRKAGNAVVGVGAGAVALATASAAGADGGAGSMAGAAAGTPGGDRRLEGVTIDTTAEEGAADEQAGAAVLAAAIAGAVAVGATGCLALGHIRRRAGGFGGKVLLSEVGSSATGTGQPLQGVCVHGDSHDAE